MKVSHSDDARGSFRLLASLPKARGKETTMTQATGEGVAVRPFRVDVPEVDLVDLRRRIAATRWPDRETVPDRSQGAKLAELQELVRYWGTDYDWRKGEAKLNAWPQFMSEIDGVEVHFYHVRSRHENALPLIISHGWPGSVFEQIKVIGPLTDPTAFGGKPEDAFDVVIPSLPGFGFSSRPTEVGWGLDRIGCAWDTLMKRLGYTRYVAQGGDWGGGIVERMGLQAPEGLLGIHTNLAATFPPDAAAAIDTGAPAPEGLSEKERAEFDALRGFLQSGGFGQWTYGKDPNQTPTKDEVLDDISLYWLTNTATSAARLYWENRNENLISAAAQQTDKITLPVAISTFPNDDLYRPPETWARRAFPNLVYFRDAERGGNFPAWEEPQLFSEELRAAFRSLR